VPARKTWLLRVKGIREALAAMEVPVVDRPIFERLFGVRRRRAIQLMHFFGGLQSGRTFLIDRIELIRQLEPLEASAEFIAEQRRRQRLVEALEGARRHRAAAQVSIPVQPLNGEITQLPAGIWLQPGSLRVDFRGAEDLLGKLFALAQGAAADFDGFRGVVDGQVAGGGTATLPCTTSGIGNRTLE
jgi:hypothetical protein